MIVIPIITLHWDYPGSSNHSSWKTSTHVSYVINIMASDGLAMKGAKTSAMVLTTNFSRIFGIQHHKVYTQNVTISHEISYIFLNDNVWCTKNFKIFIWHNHAIIYIYDIYIYITGAELIFIFAKRTLPFDPLKEHLLNVVSLATNKKRARISLLFMNK